MSKMNFLERLSKIPAWFIVLLFMLAVLSLSFDGRGYFPVSAEVCHALSYAAVIGIWFGWSFVLLSQLDDRKVRSIEYEFSKYSLVGAIFVSWGGLALLAFEVEVPDALNTLFIVPVMYMLFFSRAFAIESAEPPSLGNTIRNFLLLYFFPIGAFLFQSSLKNRRIIMGR